ncbi:MAG: 8-oxo-dGTP diphosphatase [Chthoniobacteraceae bacterium]
MNWSTWQPRERANLCFVVKAGQVLLIRKKRGLGAGKVNAPGGKLEPGETPHDAALRETQEEVGIVPRELEERGTLHFQFADGYSLHCTVFLARDFEGTPVETDEASPFWVPIDRIPYDQMWEDDQYWLPLMLEGKSFTGFFTFDGDAMLSKEVEIREEFVQP